MPEDPNADALKKLRVDLIEEVAKRDRRVSDALSRKLDDHHKEQMAVLAAQTNQLTALSEEQKSHGRWMVAADSAKLVIDQERAEDIRQKNEQAMKEKWLADQAAQEAKARKEWRDRLRRYLMPFIGAAAAFSFTLVLYVLDNLNSLRWGTQTYAITAVFVALSLTLVVLFKLNL